MRNCMMVIAALITVTSSAVAQQPTPLDDSIARLDSNISHLYRTMSRTDSTAKELMRRDGLAIAASPGTAEDARHAFAGIDSVRQRWFRGDLMIPAGFSITLTMQAPMTSRGSRRSTGVVILTGLPDTNGAANSRMSGSPGSITGPMMDGFGIALMRAVSEPTADWLTPGFRWVRPSSPDAISRCTWWRPPLARCKGVASPAMPLHACRRSTYSMPGAMPDRRST